jgi:hypothetical protein
MALPIRAPAVDNGGARGGTSSMICRGQQEQ